MYIILILVLVFLVVPFVVIYRNSVREEEKNCAERERVIHEYDEIMRERHK